MISNGRPGITVPFSACDGNVGKFMPSPAGGGRGEGRGSGESLSGEGCGERILAAKACFGCGDLIKAGSEAIVRISLGSRECVERRFGRLVESDKAGGTTTVGLVSDLEGSSGDCSSEGVTGDIDDKTCGARGCCLSVLRYSGVGRRWKEVY